MYKWILISAISLLAVTATFGTQGQPFAGSRGPMAFGAMDLNNDG